MIYAGIDPGLKGALAFLHCFPNRALNRLHMYPMPLRDDGVDAFKVIMLLNAFKPDRLVIEDQFAHKLGKMSAQSVLTMGQNWGKIVGAAQALQIQTHVVLPQTWQSKMCPKKLYPFADSKERSAAACRNFAPPGQSFLINGKIHDGMTDACLLAYYGQAYHP